MFMALPHYVIRLRHCFLKPFELVQERAPHPIGSQRLSTDRVGDGTGYVACASLRVQLPFWAVLRAFANAVGPSGQ